MKRGTPRAEVRACYLEAALKLHPDHNRSDVNAAARMAELQEAWQRYKSVAAHGREESDGGPGFTEFGVGCSFDDSDAEREARVELMDQAARGVMNQSRITAEPDTESEARPRERAGGDG